jgi:hypothetical protein
VVCGHTLTGDTFFDAIDNPDIVARFSPADVDRICAPRARLEQTP